MTKTDSDRIAELEIAEAELLSRVHLKRKDGKTPFYGPSEVAQMANAAARIHGEITHIHHLMVQRQKAAEKQPPAPDDAELERQAIAWLSQRGKRVT